MEQVTLEELRARRLRAQYLVPHAPKDALVDVVKALCGVQAQLYSAMELALRARVEGLTVEDIEKSRVHDRALVQTWCMRGSMHLLAADDLDWQLSAIAPGVVSASWRWFEKRHGIAPEKASKILDEAHRTLKANGAMTRSELAEAVAAKHGPEVKAAIFGVVQLNGLLGRGCFGENRGHEPTYVALDDWLNRPFELGSGDLETLAQRYLEGYGPANPQDLADWWGCSQKDAKQAWAGIQNEMTKMAVEGQPLWSMAARVPGSSTPDRSVRLLPAFDQYFLGYHHRDFAVRPEFQKCIFHGGQMVPTVLVDGCAAGTWKYKKQGKRLHIDVEPFTTFTSEVRELIAEEADDVGRFYHLSVVLNIL